MLLVGTGSVQGGSGRYVVMLGQNRAVLFVSLICFQKIYGLHGLNHQIIEYSKKEKVITDKQINKQRETDKHNFLSKTQALLWKGSSKNRNINRLQEKCRSGQIVRLTWDGELGNDISSKV